MIVEAETAQLARVLAVQLGSGVPLVSGLGTAIGLVRFAYLRASLAGVADQVTQGIGLNRPLAAAGLLPPLLIRLVKVGEETGQLERMLLHAARVYESKVERNLERVIGLITPILTILIGIGVGSLVLSVMDAVLSINEMVLR
jgi:general secretion pathway protein F